MSKFRNPVINLSPSSVEKGRISPDVMRARNGFVLVYSPTCPPCIHMAAEFQKLADKSKNRVAIMAIDAKKFPVVYEKIKDVRGTPTMFFVEKTGRIGAEFRGARTADAMLSFICSQISNDASGFCLV